MHMSSLTHTQSPLTFVHPCVFVLYHRQLIDLAKLLEDGLQVLLLQVSGYLPDEELDCVRLLHWEVWGGIITHTQTHTHTERRGGGQEEQTGACGLKFTLHRRCKQEEVQMGAFSGNWGAEIIVSTLGDMLVVFLTHKTTI